MSTNDKISTAAGNILAYAIGTKEPFSKVAEVITMMRSNSDWTDAEVIDVQTRVIRARMNRPHSE